MRITHVIDSLDPAGGGPPMVAARLAAAQRRLGHEVCILCYAMPSRETQTAAMLGGIPFFDDVIVQTLSPLGRSERWRGGRARQRLGKLVQPSDVLHLHGVWEPLLRIAASVAQQRGAAYIIMPHGMLDPWCLGQKRLKKRLALAMGYWKMLDRAAFIHTLNANEAELIEPLGLTCPVQVIPNGVFLEEIDPLPERGRFYAKHRELEGRPFILFLSRLHYKKGLDLLAPAFETVAKQMPDAHLVVAGPDGGAQKDFESRIAAAGLADRVHVVGPIYGAAKYEALVDATCFCLPSRQEGFSIAITEALACSVPVVITESCHFPEVAEVGAGKVVPLDSEAVGQALLHVLGDEALQASMGKAGRKLVEERYTWPRIAEQTIGAYGRALEKGGNCG